MVSRWVSLVVLVVAMLPSFVQAQTLPAWEAVVVGVGSGNTIDVEVPDGAVYRVRMLGINAPRIGAPEIGDECFGPEAAEFLEGIILGSPVRLQADVSDMDASGRLLRHVWMRDPTTGAEIFVGAMLVSEGYAEALSNPPDLAMAPVLEAAEAEARARGNGMWSACQ
jgi:micrococcal nuclease